MRDAARLEAIVRATPWLMHALEAARAVDAPDWLIGAGAVRTAVWDRLHGRAGRPELADVSVPEYERRLAAKRIRQRWPRATVVPAR